MDSVRRCHPEWDRFVLVVGGGSTVEDEAFTELPLDELPLPNRRQFYFRYDILELNTAVKPWMFEHLFGKGYDRVIYFDPDVVLYSPLIELDESNPENFLTLTPHLTGPIAGDEHPSERTILQAGTYNLGFLAVRRHPSLDAFLRWWQERLEFQCVVDTVRGLFVDQKWIDLAPGLFPGVRILRHEGYNVAYWNLGQRTVAGRGEQAMVNGQPLRFFHFSGFIPSTPRMVSRHQFGLKIADVGDAAPLFEDYAAALRAAGYETYRKAPYAWNRFTDGTRVSYAARVAYRNSAALQEACGPDPFQHPEKFRRYRDTARSPVGARAALRSYRFLSRARPLVRLLPKSLRATMREFLLGRR